MALLNTEIEIVQKESDMAGQFIRSIEGILNKDEITVLEEFGRKNDTFNREIEKFTYANSTGRVAGLKSATVTEVKDIITRVVEEFGEFKFDLSDLDNTQKEITREYT